MLGWLLSIALIILGFIQGSKLPSIWFSYHYRERIAYFKVLNKRLKKGGIVFLGDSITEQFMVSEFFPDLPVINRGISGDTTVGVMRRLKVCIRDLEPSKVVLHIGTNDLGNGKRPDAIVANIDRIIRGIQDYVPEADIYIQSVYPVRVEKGHQIKKTIVGKRKNVDILAINKGLKKITKRTHTTYINTYRYLKDRQGQIKERYTVDGLHLTPRGYEVVVRVLSKHLYR